MADAILLVQGEVLLQRIEIPGHPGQRRSEFVVTLTGDSWNRTASFLR